LSLKRKAFIIGGGITGLAAAYRLKERAEREKLPLEVTLLEASSRVGGTLHSTTQNGFLLEGGPDCFISSKPRGLGLCEELGLANQILHTKPEFRRSFVVKKGALHPVPEGFYLLAPAKLRPFLLSPLLSWSGKWRALLEPLIPAAHPHSASPPEESLASFVRRRMGKEVLDWLAQPLVAGIYAADPETLSLRATFPQFLEYERTYGSVLLGLAKRDTAIAEASGARYSLFVSLRGGMEDLVQALKQKISSVSIKLGTCVDTLRKTDEGWEIGIQGGTPLSADVVCLCLNAPESARLLERQSRSLSDLLRSIPYTTSITVNLGFDASQISHPMDGVGFVTPAKEKGPALSCTFVHRKFEDRVPEGKALLRAFLGGPHVSGFSEKSDEELVAMTLEPLRRLLGISGTPHISTVERWPLAMPQYTVGHLNRVLAIEESVLGLQGLRLAGNWQYGVGIPDCIESGERAAQFLVAYLSRIR
jgi:protoporphyrinogen/coproporphyrinogen III oxidase